MLIFPAPSDVGARPRAPGRAVPRSATFVALQRLAKRRRGDLPGALGGPVPAPPSETRGASSASETPDASLEDAAGDEPARLAAVAARALSHLPRHEEVVSRYRLFRGDDVDAKTGARCSPVMEADGEMTCRCFDCARWRRVVAGAPGEPPFWSTTPRETEPFAERTTRATKPLSTYAPMYEVFTREHVAGLAAYFRARATEWLGADAASRSFRVLELGAGSGALRDALTAATRALDERAGHHACSVTYHATDDYSFRARRFHRDARTTERSTESETVRAMDYRDALRDNAACEGHSPDAVLICWHPIREDWTSDVRRVPSVREYVLVGEADFGACGRPAETWGNRDFAPSADSEPRGGDEDLPETSRSGARAWQPPHEADGFERVDLACLSKYQVCRTDEPWLKARRSKTVSFRRRREASRA